MINKLRSLLSGNRPDLYAILDLGTVEAKALVVLVDGEQAAIIGAGRQAHHSGAIVNGMLSDAKQAAEACERALVQAESLTETIVGDKLIADRAIVGISGPMLKSVCLSLAIRRPRPQERISESELQAIIRRAERLVLRQARTAVAEEHGTADIDVGLVDACVLRVLVDGSIVNNVVGSTGTQVEVRLSNVFAPVAYLTAVGSVATALDLHPVAILSGVGALVRTPYIVGHGDAIIVDVGGDCTDIALVRHGGIEALYTLPMGGVSFARRIGRTLGVPLAAAEEIKRSYAGGRLDATRTAELGAALGEDIQTWLDGLQALLQEMAGDEALPAHLFLGGGGAALPDLVRAARAHPWLRVLPFARQPQITTIQPRQLAVIADRTHQTNNESFVVPVSLAAWAVASARRATTSPQQRALQQVLHGMGLA